MKQQDIEINLFSHAGAHSVIISQVGRRDPVVSSAKTDKSALKRAAKRLRELADECEKMMEE